MPPDASDARLFRLLMIPLFMGPLLVALDVLALAIAMPVMAKQLHISISLVSLTFVLYTLMFSGLILPLGRLMDRTDCYRLLRWGYYLFAAGSLFCCMAQDILQLCIGRSVQGVGGAVLYAVTPVLVKRAMPDSMRDRGYSWTIMASYVGILAGPSLGGLVTSMLGWRWIFALNLPLTVVGLVLLRNRSAVPQPGKSDRPFDYAGALYSFLACSLSIFVLNQGKELGWSSAPILLASGFCLLFLLLFLARQLCCSDPLIDLGLLRNGHYRSGLLTAFLAMGTGTGLTFLYPFFLTYSIGLSSMQAGVVLAIEPAFSVLACTWGAPLAAWAGCRTAVTGAMALRLLSVLALAAVAATPALVPVVVVFGLSGIATGLQYGPLMAQVMAAAPLEQAGAGGSLFSQARLLAQLMGVVLFETVFSQINPMEPAATATRDGMGAAFRGCFILAGVVLAVAGCCATGLRTKTTLSVGADKVVQP
jgi:DHA2 family methylenomycin A resistance protein-like MFS transporter